MRLQQQILREYGFDQYEISNYAKRAENAGITRDTGSDRIIWGLALELLLFWRWNVLPIHLI